jgi:hypothetical protein
MCTVDKVRARAPGDATTRDDARELSIRRFERAARSTNAD